MYTNYRNALASKLDRIRNLENGGYGIPRAKKEAPITLLEYVSDAAKLFTLVLAVILLAVILMII